MRTSESILGPPAIWRPRCAKCRAEMWLVWIETDDKPNHDRRVFECPRCQYEITEVVKYR